MGELRRGPFASGQSSGLLAICSRKSGEQLRSTHCLPLAETASEDCVRGAKPGLRARALALMGPLQFHCGNPPPADAPSTLMSMIYRRTEQGTREDARKRRRRPEFFRPPCQLGPLERGAAAK